MEGASMASASINNPAPLKILRENIISDIVFPMFLNDLHQLIALLESNHELSRIQVETDSILEIAAITERVCKQPFGGKALIFECPRGSSFPVATNLFGSLQRVCRALGMSSLDELTVRMTTLLDQIPRPVLDHLDGQISSLKDFSRFTPRLLSGHDSDLINMDPPDLTKFPFLQSWPEDGSADGHPRYITLPQVITADPGGGAPNCGMYRIQVRGPRELAIQCKAGSGAARHLDEFRRCREAMPVAIALGGAPSVTFSAMFPLPGLLDELTFAGFLRGGCIEMITCRTVPLSVPARAEVVIEGYVNPSETVVEGPFGNHTGCYSPAGAAPLLRVTAIRHRKKAVIPATLVGPPPMEDCWMAKAWERILLAFLQRLVPVVAELHFPKEWIFHQSAIISLENPSPGMVRETAGVLWAMPWFNAARLMVFIDAETNAADLSGVAWRTINSSRFSHDIFFDTSGQRTAIDATACRLPQQRIRGDADVSGLVLKRWREYGLD